MTIRNNNQGSVLLFTVLIVGFAAVAMMLVIATSGINSFADSSQQVRSADVRTKLFGCMEELLLELNEDPDYSPTSIDTLDAVCTVTIVNEGGDNRSADITYSEGNITRTVHIEMVVNGIQLLSISEL